MRKALTVAITLGLLVGTLGVPAEAQKKKKKRWVPSELTFYMHWDDDGEGGCGGMKHLSLEDHDDPGNGCGFVFQGAQEALIATGQDRLENEWPAGKGVPFVLDTSRPILGDFTVRGHASPQAWLEIELRGMVRNESVEVAAVESEPFVIATSGATGPAHVEMEFEPEDTLHRKRFASFTLTTAIRGVAAFAYIDLDAPSAVTVPVLVRR